MSLLKSIDFLLESADEPIRYRVLREFVKNERAAKEIEVEFLENAVVALWLNNLKPETPPQRHSMEHGSFDFCLENALLKAVQLGLHGGLPQMVNAVQYYIDKLETETTDGANRCNTLGIIENLLTLAGVNHAVVRKNMLASLDELYNFVCMGNYDIYISDEEREKLKAVPAIWKNRKFIKRRLVEKYGYCYPLIYDIVGLHKLNGTISAETDKKINAVIDYISTDEFHNTISDGYGILIAGDKKYYSMGWDPKYPGWFDVTDYMKNENAPKLLFFAQYISRYPLARKTKWFSDLLEYLGKYRSSHDIYAFPAEWLKENQGYAVQGSHISFGENRRKKNWREIESTFYMLILNNDSNLANGGNA